jgi:excinuclease UvrABC nuclease subunit
VYGLPRSVSVIIDHSTSCIPLRSRYRSLRDVRSIARPCQRFSSNRCGGPRQTIRAGAIARLVMLVRDKASNLCAGTSRLKTQMQKQSSHGRGKFAAGKTVQAQIAAVERAFNVRFAPDVRLMLAGAAALTGAHVGDVVQQCLRMTFR